MLLAHVSIISIFHRVLSPHFLPSLIVADLQLPSSHCLFPIPCGFHICFVLLLLYPIISSEHVSAHWKKVSSSAMSTTTPGSVVYPLTHKLTHVCILTYKRQCCSNIPNFTHSLTRSELALYDPDDKLLSSKRPRTGPPRSAVSKLQNSH